jgi:hypothetical protein
VEDELLQNAGSGFPPLDINTPGASNTLGSGFPPIDITPRTAGQPSSVSQQPPVDPELQRQRDYMQAASFFQNELAKSDVFKYSSALNTYETIPGRNTSRFLDGAFGKADYGFNPTRDNEELYAQTQGTLETLGKGFLVKLPLTTLTKIGSGVGFLGSMVTNIGQDDYFTKVADNGFSQAFEQMEEDIKNSVAPTYQEAADRDKGFFNRMFTDANFWAEDAVDGLAFMASAWVPGMAAAKFFKAGSWAVKALEKMAGARGAAGLAGTVEAVGVGTRYLQNAEKIRKGIDWTTSWAMATASEAMFEAKGVKDMVRESLDANPNLSEEQKKKIIEEAAKDTFLLNSILLGITNVFELSAINKILGRTEGATRGIRGASDLMEDATLKQATTKFDKFLESGFGKLATSASGGIFREGYIEENGQLAIQRFNEEYGSAGKISTVWDIITGVPGQYFEQTKETLPFIGTDSEAAKETAMNIGLGGLLGGGQTALSEYRQAGKDKITTEQAIKLYNDTKANWLKFSNIYQTETVEETDQDGNKITKEKVVLDANNKPKIDEQKLAAITVQAGVNTGLVKETDQDTNMVRRNFLRDNAFSEFVQAHINAGLETELLKKLDRVATAKPEELAKMGFVADETLPEQVQRYKSLAATIIKQNERITDDIRFDGTSEDQARRNRLLELAAEQAIYRGLLSDEIKKMSAIQEELNKEQSSSLSDGLVEQLNGLELRINSQKKYIDGLKASPNELATSQLKAAEDLLKELKEEKEKLIKDNPESLKNLKTSKTGFYYYENPARETSAINKQLGRRMTWKGDLENRIRMIGKEWGSYADFVDGKKNFLDMFIKDQIVDPINKKAEKEEKDKKGAAIPPPPAGASTPPAGSGTPPAGAAATTAADLEAYLQTKYNDYVRGMKAQNDQKGTNDPILSFEDWKKRAEYGVYHTKKFNEKKPANTGTQTQTGTGTQTQTGGGTQTGTQAGGQGQQTAGQLKSLNEIVEEIKKNKDFIKLSEDGKTYVNTKTGQVYQRVTTFISDEEVDQSNELLKASQIIGTKVDVLVRDFFAGKINSTSSEEALDKYDVSFVDEVRSFLSRLEDIKAYFDKTGETVLSNDVVLYNDQLGVAGTVDLLTYNSKGEFKIWDMKTMRGNNFTSKYSGDTVNKYESTKFGKSKKQKHTEQLSLYKILLKNTHGVDAKKVGILPIEVDYKEGSTTTSILNLLPAVALTPLDTVKTATINTGIQTGTGEQKGTETSSVDPKAAIEKRRRQEIGGRTQLMFAKVGDVLYSENGTKYEVLSKKDKYGRSLEFRRNDKEEGVINPKTVSEFENSFAKEYLYYKPYSEIKAINAKYDAELAALEGKTSLTLNAAKQLEQALLQNQDIDNVLDRVKDAKEIVDAYDWALASFPEAVVKEFAKGDLTARDQLLSQVRSFIKQEEQKGRTGTGGDLPRPGPNDVKDFAQNINKLRFQNQEDGATANLNFLVGLRQVEPFNSLANRTDNFDVVARGKNQVTYQRTDVNTAYHFPVATAEFAIGQKLMFKVSTKDSDYVNELTGEKYSKDKIFDDQGRVKDDQYDDVPIEVYLVDKDGNVGPLIGAVHEPKWISYKLGDNYPHIAIPAEEADQDIPPTVVKEVQKNRQIRKQIIDIYNKNPKFEVMGIVEDKSVGILRDTRDNYGLIADRVNPEIAKGGTNNRHGMFAIVSRGIVSVDKELEASDLVETSSFSSDKIADKEGLALLLIPTPTGQMFPTFIKIPTLSKAQVDFILEAWQVFTKQKPDTAGVVDAVYKGMGLIKSEFEEPFLPVLRGYIHHYMTLLDADRISKTGNGADIPDGSARLNIANDGSLQLQVKSKTGEWYSESVKKADQLPANVQELMSNLRTTIKFTDSKNSDLVGINNTKPGIFLSMENGKIISKQMTYNQHLMQTASTYVDKGIESKNENNDWVYFANPVVKMVVSSTVEDVPDPQPKKEPEMKPVENSEIGQKALQAVLALKAKQNKVKDQQENCS